MTAGPEEIALAVARLKAGAVVAFPTETVYGLGADALNAQAVARIFALKGRPAHNPLIVHISGPAMAKSVAAAWPPSAQRLADAFWPGPLTIVLPRAAAMPDAITAGGPTVAVRCPSHHLTLALLEAFGGPLVGPSANRSGSVSPTTAAHVSAAFSPDDVLVLDGGPCAGGIESTVVSLVTQPARILRPGLISADQISQALGASVEQQGTPGPGPLASPGQLPIHYAPQTRAVLVESPALPAFLRSTDPATILSHSLRQVPAPHRLIAMPTDAAAYAARLYAALREADALHLSLIVIERPPATGPIWEAIADRLARATSPA